MEQFVVVADDNEPATLKLSIEQAVKSKGGQFYEASIDFDYSCVGRHFIVGLERKTPSDFLASLHDGRLQRQAMALQSKTAIGLVVITGDYGYNSRTDKATIDGREVGWTYLSAKMQEVSLNAAGVGVLTLDQRVFPEFVAQVGVWTQREHHLRPKRKRVTLEALDPRVAVLAGFDGIGENTAAEILRQYGSLGEALEGIEDWVFIKGIGPATMKKVKEMLG